MDLPTVKAREAEECTFALIDPATITGLYITAATPTIAATSTSLARLTASDLKGTPQASDLAGIPQGSDLVDLITSENRLQGLGSREGKLYVPERTLNGKIFLRTALVKEAHVPQIFGHPGQNKVIQMLERDYYWPRLKEDVRRYLRNCYDCKRNKSPRDKTPGLLHPLPVPTTVWEHVVIDGKSIPSDRYGYDYV